MSQSKSYPISVVPAFAACRLGDISSGHYPWPPRVNDTASPNVFVNGLGWHRLGDHWITHCCPSPPPPAPPAQCHDAYLIHGAPGVFINGMEAGRIGDLISCAPHDEFVDSGSPNVFCGNHVGMNIAATTPQPNDIPSDGGNLTVEREDFAAYVQLPFPYSGAVRQQHQV
jgi:uncharacterized Zn-binding protein involved in type VI secretion